LAGRLREQLGKEVCNLILDISTDNRVKLIFECADGECVSTTYFMEGRMSDTSFLWGTLGKGAVARYGVLGDYLPIAFCPKRRPVTLVMKRRGEIIDSKIVRLVSTEISLAECREQDDDLFGLICENAIMARTIRTKVENGKCLLNDSEVVAYYVKIGSPIRYWVLQANGGFRKFEVTLENELRELPLLLFEWWDEFEGKHSQIGSILLHDVRRDEVTEISTVFGLSQSLDSRIVSPRYFNNHVPGKAQTLGERLDESVARELSKPNEMFIRSTYKRLDDTAEKRGIRLKLDKALKKSNSASLANRNVVGK